LTSTLPCPDCGHDNSSALKFCDRCGASLSLVPDDELDSYPSPVDPGTIIDGKYQILTEIERGGMGVVYRAHDVTLDRKVAVKVLPEHFNANPDVVARFKREARAMASLDHANIVQVYAIGQHERCHYFVMKYLDGRTVADELKAMRERGGPFFDQHMVVHVLGEVARGLIHAHLRGLVHRDIKPSNIMLAPDGHVTIMDFGIVKHQQGGAPLTRAGVVFGTPEYMAPEQAQGQANPDPTTDLYALGIVAYEMLVGEPPFHGPTPLEVVLRHIQEEPVPISRRRADVLPELQAVIFRMIAKVPQGRFQSGKELLAALGSIELGPAPSSPRRRGVAIEAESKAEVLPPTALGAEPPRFLPPVAGGAGGLPAPRSSVDRLPDAANTGAPPRVRAEGGQVAMLDFERRETERRSTEPERRPTASERPGRYQLTVTRPDSDSVRPVAPPGGSVLRRSLPVVLVVAGLASVAGVGALLWHRHTHPAPIVPVADAEVLAEVDTELRDAAPATTPLPDVAVQVHVKSNPSEALVFAPDQPETPLATTPALMLQPPNMMTRDLVLRKPGFQDLRVTVSFMSNREYVFELEPLK